MVPVLLPLVHDGFMDNSINFGLGRHGFTVSKGSNRNIVFVLSSIPFCIASSVISLPGIPECRKKVTGKKVTEKKSQFWVGKKVTGKKVTKKNYTFSQLLVRNKHFYFY